MRNKVLAAFWMVIGAFAAVWIGLIPLELVVEVVRRFAGNDPRILTIPVLLFTLPAMAYGATWFQTLFYKGMLWGYRPDKDY